MTFRWIFRCHSASRRFYITILGLILLNGIIYLVFDSYFSKKTCQETRFQKLSQLNFLNGDEEFDWKGELRVLADVIPVLESKSSSNNREEATYPWRNITLPVVDEYIKIESLIDLLSKDYSPLVKDRAVDDITNAFYDDKILNCDEIKYMERRKRNPKLVYGPKEASTQMGELFLHNGETINFVMKSFSSDQAIDDMTSDIDDVDHAEAVDLLNALKFAGKNPSKFAPKSSAGWLNVAIGNLYKLLQMRMWPGIPRIYAICVSTKNETDVMTPQYSGQEVHSIRYIMERFDDAFHLCDHDVITEECAQLSGLRRFVKSQSNPPVVALKIMRNFIEVFENFFLNGFFPYNFTPRDWVITRDYRVILTSVDIFIPLEENKENPGTYKRILSDVMCKFWSDCPTPGWEHQQMLFKLGQSCKEVRGHCGDDKRCWGMDSTIYMCAFSKWLFAHLTHVVPLAWPHAMDLSKMLICSQQGIPQYRCSWSDLLHKTDDMLYKAIDSWGD
ncbi:unnamed protein product [Clavelina lepadiformis]|uniref:Uncharacterized protein n=1 Tax=Clavelina lepadiformis TaxID=159417 RepID=A0ABP0FJ82_CLALP